MFRYLLAGALALAMISCAHAGDGLGHMVPYPGQIGGPTNAWNATDPDGNPIDCTGTQTQCLQEFYTASATGAWPGEVNCYGVQVLNESGTITSGNPVITGITDFTNLGIAITNVNGPGIAAGARIVALNPVAGTATINSPATASGSITVKFGTPIYPLTINAGIVKPPTDHHRFIMNACNVTSTAAVTGAAWTFDSAIEDDFEWRGGQLVYGPGSPLSVTSCPFLIRPKGQLPGEGLITVTGSIFKLPNIASPATGGMAQADICAEIDKGSIGNNTIETPEANGTGEGSTANTMYAFVAFGAQANTAFFENRILINVGHLVPTVVQMGTGTLYQTHYYGNTTMIEGMHPTAGGTCVNDFGNNNKYFGHCSNQEAAGNVGIGLKFQPGSYNNYAVVTYQGVTTHKVDNGTGNVSIFN